jgi:hypothetical protein
MLAGPASADFISAGMADSGGQTYSQGMMAGSAPWAGEIYSQGMMMSTGDIYSQGMEITMLGGTNSQSTDTAADFGGTTNNQGTGGVTNLGGTAKSSAPSQGCVGTAPNCTDSVTDAASVFGPHNNGSADPLLSGSADSLTFVSSGPLNIVKTEPIPEPAGLALLAPALLWFVLWGGVGATKSKENTPSQEC